MKVKGHFGILPRRLLYFARNLNRDFVRNVHCLSEHVNQQVLSVKTGKVPPKYKSFKKHVLNPLLTGQVPDFGTFPADLETLKKPEIREVCKRIAENIDLDPPRGQSG